MVASLTDATSGAMTSLERDYYSMQYALYFCVALDVLGGIAFLAVAFFVLDDKAKAQQGDKNKSSSVRFIRRRRNVN